MKENKKIKIDKIIEKIEEKIYNTGLEIKKLKSMDTFESYGLVYPDIIKPRECQCIISITRNFDVILDAIKLDIDTILDFEYMLKNIDGIRRVFVSVLKDNVDDYKMDERHICKSVDSKNKIKEILDSLEVEYNNDDYRLLEILITKYDGYEYFLDSDKIDADIDTKSKILFKCISRDLSGLSEDILECIYKKYYIKRDCNKIFPREDEVICCSKDVLDNKRKYVIHNTIRSESDLHTICFK